MVDNVIPNNNGVAEAEAQISQARSQLAEQKISATKARETLSQRRKSLPTRTSQMELRQGKLKGLIGRERRRDIEKAEKKIQQQQTGIKKFEAGLGEFEETILKPQEQKISEYKVEQQKQLADYNKALADYNRRKQEIDSYNYAKEIVEKADAKGKLHLHAQWDTGLVQKLAKQILRERSINKNYQLREAEKLGLTPVFKSGTLDIAGYTGVGGVDILQSHYKGDLTTIDYQKLGYNVPKIDPVYLKTLQPTTIPPMISNVLVSPTIKKKGGKLSDDINVYSRSDVGSFNQLGIGATRIVSSVIGSKEDFKKGKEIIQPSLLMVSATQPGDALKGEQFREQGEILIERFGTTTEQLPQFETKTLRQLREESLILGGASPTLFLQKAPTTISKKIVPFIPIVGQIEPTVSAFRNLSGEYQSLVGAESILGMGGVSQKEFRKATLKAGLQTGLLALDVAFVKGVGTAGIKLFGTEARAIRQLQKATPELFLGFEREAGKKSTLLIGSRREIGKIKSETLTKFDVFKIGDKSYQIQKGRGVQRILKDGEKVKVTKFTLFGEAKEVPARIIDEKGFLKIITEVEKPTKGIFSEIQILTEAKTPEMLKVFGVGLQQPEGTITKVLSFSSKKAIQPKAVVAWGTGKEEMITLFGTPKIKIPTKEVEAIGIIKKLGKIPEVEYEVIQTGGLGLKVITDTEKKVGAMIGLQTETKLLETPKVISQIKPILPSASATEIITIQQPVQVSVPMQQALLETPDTRQIVTPTTSAYAGTGLYERTEEFGQLGRQQFGQLGRQEIGQLDKQEFKQYGRQEIAPLSKQEFKQMGGQEFKQYGGQEFKQFGRLDFKQISRLGFKQIGKQKLKQAPATSTTTTPTITPKTIAPKVPIKTKTTFKDILKRVRDKKDDGEFEVFGRRFGMDVSIGKTKTKKEAEKKLKGFLQKTLGRSGKIKKGTTELSFGELNLGSFEFRPAKKDVTRIVQKREFSLGTFGERSEIQRARKSSSKSKKRKNKWF